MVAWIVNDLSLDGQYLGVPDFLADFEEILAARTQLASTGHGLSCARELRYRAVFQATTVAEAVYQMKDQARRNLALAWLTKGPFWTNPPGGMGVTYFGREDVTNQGLGEAARRRWLSEDARTFSFGGLSQFEIPSLDVQCLRDGVDLEEVTKVPNAWTRCLLTKLSPVVAPRPSWAVMIDKAVSELSHLQIARERAIQEIPRYPYDQGASDRLFGVLKRLDELARVRATHGDNSAPIVEWLRVNVTASGANFSSENPKDRSVFIFGDPDSGEDLYCPWHGKVHNPLQYRIHYQWPMPAGQRRLKVLYIGQKLTKD